jgi:4-amino-4-deoxy-L-arabinose transferase-like glycosyltransferase
LVLLLPVLAAGLFARVYYTPDEPREASLAAAIADHPAALPTLGGVTFAEKPPLLYWLSGAAMTAAGSTPPVARWPNLLYGLVTALSLALIARRAAGVSAGYLTGVVTVTSLQLYDVMIWLATDAPLLAGVALALAGLYAAVTTEVPAARRRGYAVFALGLVLAFYAKGLAGWMVPGFAALTVWVGERRWRDLRRLEPWLVLPVVAAFIAPWIVAVHARPDGEAALRVLFWTNLVGRAVALEGPGVGYATGHPNSLGKYLLELPLYLLPWTALGVVAFVRSVKYLRLPGATGTAWRLAFGAIVPATVLLSLAATARGVYYAPPMLGFALMIGLEFGDARTAGEPARGLALRLTRWLVASFALVIAIPALLLMGAPATRDATHLVLAAVTLVGASYAVHCALRTRGSREHVLRDLTRSVCVTMVVVATPLWWGLNPLVDLQSTAQELRAAAGDHPLRLYQPDETTVAMSDLYLNHAPALSDGERPSDPALRYVWLVPDHYRWKPAQWWARLGYQKTAIAVVSPPVVAPEGVPGVRIDALIERAGGRRYALLAIDPPPKRDVP